MAKAASPARAARRAAGTPVATATAKPKGVVVAYPHPVGQVDARFHVCLNHLMVRDAMTARHIVGDLPMSSGANIVTARNTIVRKFLKETSGEWLWMIDSDMTFEPDTLDRLLDSARRANIKIVGGLCFALLKGEAQEVVPTLYGFTDAKVMIRYNGFPENQIVQVVGTGAACLLVHREVFETIYTARIDAAMAKEHGVPEGRLRYPKPWPWFAESPVNEEWGGAISEDLTFCLRAASVGYPVHVDTSIKTGHVKPTVIDEQTYWERLPGEGEPAPTYVVIPVLGRQDLTDPLLKQIVDQGGYDKVFVLDNGADSEPFDDHGLDLAALGIKVIPAAGKSIHAMWNMGIREALANDQRCNIVFLNNDLILDDDFLANLTRGLRAHPQIAAVSANYDNRDFPEEVQACKGIAAGREDGTGGLAGFAFAVRGELYLAGCPMFDEQFELWYGDTDFVMNLEKANAVYGIVKAAKVTHIGGGSQTAGDGHGKRLTPERKAAAERDRVRFEKKWAGAL